MPPILTAARNAAVVLLVTCSTLAAQDSLTEARRLLLKGQYAEAEEAYAPLAAESPAAAAVGTSRSQAAVGQADKAVATLQAAAEKHPGEAALHAELAVRHFERGDYPAAAAAVEAALNRDANALPARWIRCELLRTAGKLKEAGEAHEWFIGYYNNHQAEIKDAESLRWIGLAAAEFARWNRLSGQFGFLVNTLYPDALELEENDWRSHYRIGLLFLEKYNEAEATRSFNDALKINPQAAEVHAAAARLALQNYELDAARRSIERALEINPNLVEAQRLRADLELANFKTDEPLKLLEKALELNPLDEETLGRLAAVHVIRLGRHEDLEGTPAGKIIEAVNARNPHAGMFYFTLAEKLDGYRKFTAAERFYREAVERMPQLVGPRAQLGMMHMRLGNEVQAKKLFDESFEIDPFNVRVNNMLEVLDVLSGYAVLETEHFIIKFDRGQDELLARYAARYLEEEVYPQLCKRFGFEPEGKSLLEFFNRAKGTDGHGWFSARMVGLPYIGTVGACAGKMVGMASPNGMDEKFNWARVLRHEFVHVLNLQQTNFNIPHWFTEALAVLNEELPRPEIWDQLLAARVPKGELFTLEDINLGFIRPGSSGDWHMAYCQAELYAQYMLQTYGEDALAKMLQAYADNLSTPAALKRCFDVEVGQFEKGYRAYIEQIAAGLSVGIDAEPELKFSQLQKAVEDDPDNADLLARLAQAQWQRKEYAQARTLARQALELKPKHQRATYVLARVHLLIGDKEIATKLLEECLDEEQPNEDVVTLLAELKSAAKDFAEAARVLELGRKAKPHDTKWLKPLAALYLKSGRQAKALALLAEAAERDYDELLVRKTLAKLTVRAEDYEAGARWANQGIRIDVMDAELHQLRGRSLAKLERFAEAAEEYDVLVRLRPNDLDALLALAEAHVGAGQPAKAKAVLERLLQRDPDHVKAKQLLEKLAP